MTSIIPFEQRQKIRKLKADALELKRQQQAQAEAKQRREAARLKRESERKDHKEYLQMLKEASVTKSPKRVKATIETEDEDFNDRVLLSTLGGDAGTLDLLMAHEH